MRSARNALKHGGFTNSLIDEQEKSDFVFYQQGLKEQFNPSNMLQRDLIEQLALIMVKIRRIENAEGASWLMARERDSAEPELMLSKWGFIEETKLKEATSLMLGYEGRWDLFGLPLHLELNSNKIDKLAPWDYIQTHMPLLTEHLYRQCEERDIPLNRLIYDASEGIHIPPMRVVVLSQDGTETVNKQMTREQIKASGYKVKPTQWNAYVGELKENTQCTLIAEAARDYFEERAEQIITASTPDTNTLTQLSRCKKDLDRQYQQKLGMLLKLKEYESQEQVVKPFVRRGG